MASKPVVALALSQDMCGQMFFPEDLARLRDAAEVLDAPIRPEPPVVGPMLRDATVAITGWGSPPFDDAMLECAPHLRLLAHSAGSVKPIVGPAVYDRGVRVITAAAANATPVAEFTVAMMVAMLKQVPWIATAYAAGDPDARARNHVRELRDMTVGLIGASRVGREVIRMLRTYPRLGIKLFDPHVGSDEAKLLGTELASVEDVCRCDVISVHAPNLPETRHIINARTLALMPDHAVLINTARGALIDEDALVAEVRKRPLYVLLDVTDPEPPLPDSPLRTQPRIILTPHIAGSTHQARRDMGRLAVEEVLRFLDGKPLQHEVTREMLPTQA
jgi:phosphoglycerate dehydrogenase-like enzyme